MNVWSAGGESHLKNLGLHPSTFRFSICQVDKQMHRSGVPVFVQPVVLLFSQGEFAIQATFSTKKMEKFRSCFEV
jgi:hypothetical protein